MAIARNAVSCIDLVLNKKNWSARESYDNIDRTCTYRVPYLPFNFCDFGIRVSCGEASNRAYQ